MEERKKLEPVWEQRPTVTVLGDAEVMYVTKSGWGDYHTIREDGELGDSDYQRLTALDIMMKYGIDITKYL